MNMYKILSLGTIITEVNYHHKVNIQVNRLAECPKYKGGDAD